MTGRFQTHTVVPEGAELDDTYQKTVADIEEQTQRSGWLFGRGAFDKADLQYLRDFNNSLRYKEEEIEDKEKALWERERARVEAEAAAAAAAALKRQSSGGSGSGALGGATGATAGLRGPGAHAAASRPAPLLLPVKVKPAGSRTTPRTTSPGSTAVAASGGDPPGPPTCANKRLKTQDGRPAPADGLQHPGSGGPGAFIATVKSEPAVTPGGTTSGNGAAGAARASPSDAGAAAAAPSTGQQGGPSQQQQQQQHHLGRSVSAPAGRSGPEEEVTRKGEGVAGLATLLGGYGSDDDDEEQKEEKGEAAATAPGRGARVHGTANGGGGGGGGDGGSNGGGSAEGSGSERRRGPAGGGSAAPGTGLGPSQLLPPPVGLLSPEELLSDPRVISEGLLATRPVPQSVQGGDAWDSEEASGSESD